MIRHLTIVSTVTVLISISVVGFPSIEQNSSDAAHSCADNSLDTMSLMQSRHIHVEHVGLNNASSSSSWLVRSFGQAIASLREITMQGAGNIFGAVQRTNRHATSTRGAFLPIIILMLAIGVFGCVLAIVLKKRDEPIGSSESWEQFFNIPNELESNIARRPAPEARSPPRSNVQQSSASYIVAATPPRPTPFSPRSLAPSMHMVPDRGSAGRIVVPPMLPFLQSRGTTPDKDRVVPPALCPSLVLPICEARFGVPIHELSAVSSSAHDCSIGIVGMSNNTLLRATLRKNGIQRSLEIGMPEENSQPRSIVGPAVPGAKSLDIRGMKGVYYGQLEMRTSGACYVVKDQATVLSIDGNTNSLKLSIHSSSGAEIASVRCASEPFRGVDHIEIRVESGVDTILILSCVLAVLLLSPFPPT